MLMNEPCFVLDRLDKPNFKVLETEETVRRKTCPFTQTHLSDSGPTNLTPKCCVLSGEAENTNFNVFGVTQPGKEHTTFLTRGEHANHYTTKALPI